MLSYPPHDQQQEQPKLSATVDFDGGGSVTATPTPTPSEEGVSIDIVDVETNDEEDNFDINAVDSSKMDDEAIARMLAADLNATADTDDEAIARMIADSEYQRQNQLDMIQQQRTQAITKWVIRLSVILLIGILICGIFVLLSTVFADDTAGDGQPEFKLLSLKDLLAPSTSPDVITDPTASQNKAWVWLQTQHTNDTILQSREPNIRESLIEAFALATVYYSMGGSFGSWYNKYEFEVIGKDLIGNTISPCYWKDEEVVIANGTSKSSTASTTMSTGRLTNITISCNVHEIDQTNQHPTITGLDLSNNNLIGTIPGEIYLLSNLQVLNLDSNRLYDSIPTNELSMLTNLETLKLGNNDLTGNLSELFCQDEENGDGGGSSTFLKNNNNMNELSTLQADCDDRAATATPTPTNANTAVEAEEEEEEQNVDCTCCTACF